MKPTCKSCQSLDSFFLCNVGFGSNLCVGNLHLWENEKKINFFKLYLLLMEIFMFVNEIFGVLREFLVNGKVFERNFEIFKSKYSIENQLNRLKSALMSILVH